MTCKSSGKHDGWIMDKWMTDRDRSKPSTYVVVHRCPYSTCIDDSGVLEEHKYQSAGGAWKRSGVR